MDSKKIGILVALVVVVVVAIIFSARRAGIGVRASMPQGQLEQQVELIDSKTLEVISKPMAEWEKLGHQATGTKNPNTGTYTMVAPMVCRACGQKIPAVSRFKRPDYDPTTVVCPRCGKSPFNGPYTGHERPEEPAQPAKP
jgi:hypothetical protein